MDHRNAMAELTEDLESGRRGPFRMYYGLLSGRNRHPLPPGHPTTWDAITHDTILDGAPYPYPVFADVGAR